MPAQTICHAVFTMTCISSSPLFCICWFLFSLLYLDIKQSIVHAIVPQTKTNMAVILMLLSSEGSACTKSCSANNIKTPKKPKINPNTVGKLEKFSFHFGLSSTTNHIAVAAAIMLTIPLDIYCSDQI